MGGYRQALRLCQSHPTIGAEAFCARNASVNLCRQDVDCVFWHQLTVQAHLPASLAASNGDDAADHLAGVFDQKVEEDAGALRKEFARWQCRQ